MGSSTVKFEDCEIYSNTATYVGFTLFEPFPERFSIARCSIRDVFATLPRTEVWNHLWRRLVVDCTLIVVHQSR